MSNVDLANLDLNVLLPLRALLAERSVTRAAERLSVGQPSVSIALAKLRRMFDDPLLIPHGRARVLSPLAESLVSPLDDILEQIGTLFDRTETFDPAIPGRDFTLVCDEYFSLLLAPPLLVEVRRVAPNVRIHIVTQPADHVSRLRRRTCDLLMWRQKAQDDGPYNFPSAAVFSDDYVVTVAEESPDVGDRMSEEDALTLPFIRVSGLSPSMLRVGELNEKAVTETFTCAVHMLSGTSMFTILPRRLFERFRLALGLREVAVDVRMPTHTEAMYWHPGFTADPAHLWLRATLERLAAEID